MSNALALNKYKELVSNIAGLFRSTQRAAAMFYWQTGQWIVEVEQDGEVRAEYGSGLLPKLSAELTEKCGAGFSVESLQRMRRFYLDYPKKSAPTKLSWAKYLELRPVKDKKLREHLKQRAEKEGLGSREIRALVREIRAGEKKAGAVAKPLPPLKRPADLRLGTCRKSQLPALVTQQLKTRVTGEDNPSRGPLTSLDCGFYFHHPATADEVASVTVVAEPSWTFVAVLEEVVDGDTLWVVVDLLFGNTTRQKLRLRGIDTAELNTPAGRPAKKYVEKLLPAGSLIILKTTKCRTDTHGRFVADVFFRGDGTTPEDILLDGVWLNQHLLDKGYAVRMAE